MFKFKKGDQVRIVYGSAFGNAGRYIQAMSTGSTVTAQRVGRNGENEYKLKGYLGWWHESNLVKA